MISVVFALAASANVFCDAVAALGSVDDDDRSGVHSAFVGEFDVDRVAAHGGEACGAALADAVVVAAAGHHRAAQRHKTLVDYELADGLYALLSALPLPSAQRIRLTFFHAELLYDMGRWNEAERLYRDVVRADPAGMFARTSAYNRVLAVENRLHRKPASPFENGVMTFTDSDVEGRRWNRVPPPAPSTSSPSSSSSSSSSSPDMIDGALSPTELDLVLACEAYLRAARHFERDRKVEDEVVAVLFKLAFVHQQHHRGEAIGLLEQLMVQHPNTEAASRCAGLLLDELWRHGEKDTAARVAEIIAAEPRWMQGANREAVEAVRRLRSAPPPPRPPPGPVQLWFTPTG